MFWKHPLILHIQVKKLKVFSCSSSTRHCCTWHMNVLTNFQCFCSAGVLSFSATNKRKPSNFQMNELCLSHHWNKTILSSLTKLCRWKSLLPFAPWGGSGLKSSTPLCIEHKRHWQSLPPLCTTHDLPLNSKGAFLAWLSSLEKRLYFLHRVLFFQNGSWPWNSNIASISYVCENILCLNTVFFYWHHIDMNMEIFSVKSRGQSCSLHSIGRGRMFSAVNR